MTFIHKHIYRNFNKVQYMENIVESSGNGKGGASAMHTTFQFLPLYK